MTPLSIAFFGSSLVSAYWNGAATYYRGVLQALAAEGHRIVFYEPDAYERQQHRDIPDPPWAQVVVYPIEGTAGVERALDGRAAADLIVKASGVGVFDALLEERVPAIRRRGRIAAFWDVDAPATLDRIAADRDDPFRALIPAYDLVLTYGGGAPVVDAYRRLGARSCVPIYNGLDPATHHPAAPEPRFACDLGLVANRLPDRERADRRVLRRGGGRSARPPLPARRQWLGRQGAAAQHRLSRPPLHPRSQRLQLFGAGGLERQPRQHGGLRLQPGDAGVRGRGAGACVITDAWEGIAQFFEPGREILVAENGPEVAEQLARLTPDEARRIGAAARPARSPNTPTRNGSPCCSRCWRGSSRGLGDERRSTAAVDRLRIVILGLSITSSWGNGHATTYRGLVRALCRRGHQVLFLERDAPWYSRPSRSAAAALWHDPALRQRRRAARALERGVARGRSGDRRLLRSGWDRGRRAGAADRRRAGRLLRHRHPGHLGRSRRESCEYLAAELIPGFDLYLSFTGGPLLRRIEDEFGARAARALYCSVDPDCHRPAAVSPDWDLGYLGTYSADRQPALDRLIGAPARRLAARPLRGRRLAVSARARMAANLDRIDHIDPGRHAGFYARQRFTLNVTRADMIRCGWSPSVRLFEAAACGVPIISDWWPGLDEFSGRAAKFWWPAMPTRCCIACARCPRPSGCGSPAMLASECSHCIPRLHRAGTLETYVAEARDAGRARTVPAAKSYAAAGSGAAIAEAPPP